ncbi:3-ketoacyl-ACP reductase [Streptacidiphilus pinicola]|uniref:3-ketoacyl-ACP reductase n=1 Tax=Streptacidiphilus pinicola TaxID=2219663 RepID=A0A2X0ICE2_9ACTN|nr:SDR family oxidoreductase [Streptacidiphilus pinicola]RAG82177.1 3-ketoacyl-ACP reductase [Streptacidiphilus pinicola]
MPFVAGLELTRSRVAIVTEGARGIGRYAALRLAEDGFDVVIAYSHDRSAAEDIRAAIEERAGRALTVETDVADETAVVLLFQQAEEAFGAVDVVVNCAEIVMCGSVCDMAPEEFAQMHRTNVLGAFVVGRNAARRVRRGGALINLASYVSETSRSAYGAYAAGKAAVNALTVFLTGELRERNVTVNAVASAPVVADPASPEQPGDLARIAEAIAFLAGPGHWVNGQVLRVDH